MSSAASAWKSRGLCCVLHIVHDLEGAAELYTRASFMVGPQIDFIGFAIQRDIQVPGFYLSLLSPPVPPTGIPVLTDPDVAPRFAGVHLDPVEGEPGIAWMVR